MDKLWRGTFWRRSSYPRRRLLLFVAFDFLAIDVRNASFFEFTKNVIKLLNLFLKTQLVSRRTGHAHRPRSIERSEMEESCTAVVEFLSFRSLQEKSELLARRIWSTLDWTPGRLENQISQKNREKTYQKHYPTCSSNLDTRTCHTVELHR